EKLRILGHLKEGEERRASVMRELIRTRQPEIAVPLELEFALQLAHVCSGGVAPLPCPEREVQGVSASCARRPDRGAPEVLERGTFVRAPVANDFFAEDSKQARQELVPCVNVGTEDVLEPEFRGVGEHQECWLRRLRASRTRSAGSSWIDAAPTGGS